MDGYIFKFIVGGRGFNRGLSKKEMVFRLKAYVFSKHYDEPVFDGWMRKEMWVSLNTLSLSLSVCMSVCLSVCLSVTPSG